MWKSQGMLMLGGVGVRLNKRTRRLAEEGVQMRMMKESQTKKADEGYLRTKWRVAMAATRELVSRPWPPTSHTQPFA